jgi:S-DNA-T family DNA segregation ATPase FtsK/SpoIIIE
VISGLIKANFPGRIALKVASAVDSRVILDSNGAEKISDIGTGLYVDGSMPKPALFRAPYIEDVSRELQLISPPERPRKTFWQKFSF